MQIYLKNTLDAGCLVGLLFPIAIKVLKVQKIKAVFLVKVKKGHSNFCFMLLSHSKKQLKEYKREQLSKLNLELLSISKLTEEENQSNDETRKIIRIGKVYVAGFKIDTKKRKSSTVKLYVT